jgi:integrase
MKRGTPTRYPGVLRIDDRTYWIRAKVVDPKTGKNREVQRLLEGVSLQEAAQKRAELMKDVKNPIGQAERVRVGEFAKLWIESKTLSLDSGTVRTYADALEQHILPALGDFYYDALTSFDVQRWIDGAVLHGWSTNVRSKGEGKKVKKERRSYARNTVAGWLRVFRTMTNDAMEALRLDRDPTLRVSLPQEAIEAAEANALSADELAAFLDAMRTHYPQHHGLVVMLAFTGLRFCHASALRWEDWDEEVGVIRVVRKQVRGEVGPVSRKKRAPKEYPVEPELAEVLRQHRCRLQSMKAAELREQGLRVLDVSKLDVDGWMFPSNKGTLRTPNSLDRAWAQCLAYAKIEKRFTVHGLRYTFTDLVRLANVDAVVRRALTGHVTEQMQRKYSSVGLEEKRAAIAGVIRLVPPERVANDVRDGAGGPGGGPSTLETATAG